MIASAETVSPIREHRLLLIAMLTMTLVVFVYWHSFSRMVEMWSLTDYQYGWLVYPIALYILWRKRTVLANTPVDASWPGVAATALIVFAWIIARTVGVQVVEFASASLLSVAVFWAVAGTPALKVAAFPLSLLLAAVPTGEFLVVYLQESTADIASALLHVAGVPAYREGMFLTLPGGSFEVAEMCGGLRYLLAALMASMAYAYLTYSALWKRVLFVAIAGVTMVVANGVRAFIVMCVASATDMQVLGGKDHVYFGMFLFAAVFAGLIYIGDRYADRLSRTADYPVFFPEDRASLPVTVAVLLFLAAGPVLIYVQMRQPAPEIFAADLPALPECHGPDAWQYDWSPEFGGADHVQRASYDCGRHRAGIYFASYATQEQGKELIGSGNRLWPYDWRRYVDETDVAINAESGSLEVRQVYVYAPDRSMLIWYWYQVGDSSLLNGVSVKLATALAALSLRPAEASVVAVHVEGDPEATADVLREMLEPKALALMSWYRASADEVR